MPTSNSYPSGVKYRLILANPKQNEIILLYDNHSPKGPHIHRVDREENYNFTNVQSLLNDFLQDSLLAERRYHENKTDRD